jgi:hypothetical protein
MAFIDGLDNPTFKPVFGTGDLKIRLPKGLYAFDTSIANGERATDLLYLPMVKLAGDLTIKLDAALAQPLSVKAPEPAGASTFGMLGYRRTHNGQSMQATLFTLGGFEGMAVAQIGEPLSPEELSSIVVLHTNTAADPHTFYRLAYPFGGRLPNGLSRAPGKNELARVESTIGGLKPDSQASKGELPLSVHGLGGSTVLFPVAYGAKAVEYVTTEDVRWQSALSTRHARTSRCTRRACPSRPTRTSSGTAAVSTSGCRW